MSTSLESCRVPGAFLPQLVEALEVTSNTGARIGGIDGERVGGIPGARAILRAGIDYTFTTPDLRATKRLD